MTRPTRTVTRNRYELPSVGGDLAWQERAACAGTDIGLWFRPDGREHDPARVRRAKGYCLICETRATRAAAGGDVSRCMCDAHIAYYEAKAARRREWWRRLWRRIGGAW